MRILILGASYGSLLSTKLLMAGHDVSLVCLPEEAELINAEGTTIRITLRGEDEPRLIRSKSQPGTLNAGHPARRVAQRLRSGRAGHAGTAVPRG